MSQDERRQQIERLLRFPGVGPLAAGAIARNVGASPEEVQPALDRLVKEGRVTRLDDGRYAPPEEQA